MNKNKISDIELCLQNINFDIILVPFVSDYLFLKHLMQMENAVCLSQILYDDLFEYQLPYEFEKDALDKLKNYFHNFDNPAFIMLPKEYQKIMEQLMDMELGIVFLNDENMQIDKVCEYESVLTLNNVDFSQYDVILSDNDFFGNTIFKGLKKMSSTRIGSLFMGTVRYLIYDFGFEDDMKNFIDSSAEKYDFTSHEWENLKYYFSDLSVKEIFDTHLDLLDLKNNLEIEGRFLADDDIDLIRKQFSNFLEFYSDNKLDYYLVLSQFLRSAYDLYQFDYKDIVWPVKTGRFLKGKLAVLDSKCFANQSDFTLQALKNSSFTIFQKKDEGLKFDNVEIENINSEDRQESQAPKRNMDFKIEEWNAKQFENIIKSKNLELDDVVKIYDPEEVNIVYFFKKLFAAYIKKERDLEEIFHEMKLFDRILLREKWKQFLSKWHEVCDNHSIKYDNAQIYHYFEGILSFAGKKYNFRDKVDFALRADNKMFLIDVDVSKGKSLKKDFVIISAVILKNPAFKDLDMLFIYCNCENIIEVEKKSMIKKMDRLKLDE